MWRERREVDCKMREGCVYIYINEEGGVTCESVVPVMPQLYVRLMMQNA